MCTPDGLSFSHGLPTGPGGKPAPTPKPGRNRTWRSPHSATFLYKWARGCQMVQPRERWEGAGARRSVHGLGILDFFCTATIRQSLRISRRTSQVPGLSSSHRVGNAEGHAGAWAAGLARVEPDKARRGWEGTSAKLAPRCGSSGLDGGKAWIDGLLLAPWGCN